jgi:hypothetical protein
MQSATASRPKRLLRPPLPLALQEIYLDQRNGERSSAEEYRLALQQTPNLTGLNPTKSIAGASLAGANLNERTTASAGQQRARIAA